MQRVPVAGAVAQHQRRRPRLTGGDGIARARHRSRPATAGLADVSPPTRGRSAGGAARTRPGARRPLGQRIGEIPVLPSAEPVAGHVDRRSERSCASYSETQRRDTLRVVAAGRSGRRRHRRDRRDGRPIDAVDPVGRPARRLSQADRAIDQRPLIRQSTGSAVTRGLQCEQRAFAPGPPRYWPMEPSPRMTRWQGMTTGTGLWPHALPTARTAAGLPAAIATWRSSRSARSRCAGGARSPCVGTRARAAGPRARRTSAAPRRSTRRADGRRRRCSAPTAAPVG